MVAPLAAGTTGACSLQAAGTCAAMAVDSKEALPTRLDGTRQDRECVRAGRVPRGASDPGRAGPGGFSRPCCTAPRRQEAPALREASRFVVVFDKEPEREVDALVVAAGADAVRVEGGEVDPPVEGGHEAPAELR